MTQTAIGPDGTIYIVVVDIVSELFALSRDGTRMWQWKPEEESTPGGLPQELVSGPAVGPDGTIYVGSTNGNYYALGPDGSTRWKFTTLDSQEAVVAPEGTVYVVSSSELYAIDPDGSRKWTASNPVGSNPIGLPRSTGKLFFGLGAAMPKAAAVGPDGTVYFASPSGELRAIDPAGSLRWRFSADIPFAYCALTIGMDNTVYALYAGSLVDTTLYAFGPGGAEKWKVEIGPCGGQVLAGPFGDLAIGGADTIYVDTSDALYAIDPGGRQKWRLPVDCNASFEPHPMVSAEGTVYVGSAMGDLYAVNPNGTQKWKRHLSPDPRPVALDPVVPQAIGSDGTIYATIGGVELLAIQ